MGSGVFEHEKHPIYPAEIERCRNRISIGQEVRIRIQSVDLDFRKRTVQKMCMVEEKHRWILVVRDAKGRRYSVTYVDMIMQGER